MAAGRVHDDRRLFLLRNPRPRRALITVSAGAVAGLLVFLTVRRLLATMLYDTSTGDVRLLAMAVAILAMVATIAAWIPTRRAVRVDPATTLRLD